MEDQARHDKRRRRARRAASPIPEETLDCIGALRAIEGEIRGKAPDEHRGARLARAGPLLDNLYAWLVATTRKLSKKSDAAGAILAKGSYIDFAAAAPGPFGSAGRHRTHQHGGRQR
ncbi:MAG: transposase [Steroidobacteraceae bacterium]